MVNGSTLLTILSAVEWVAISNSLLNFMLWSFGFVSDLVLRISYFYRTAPLGIKTHLEYRIKAINKAGTSMSSNTMAVVL